MDDDDDFGDVVDFGDGATYNLHKSPTEPSTQQAETTTQQAPEQQQSPQQETVPSAEVSVPTRSEVPVDEYDRGSRAEGSKSLFNDRLGKLEPYSRNQAPKQPFQRRPSTTNRAPEIQRPEPQKRPFVSPSPAPAAAAEVQGSRSSTQPSHQPTNKSASAQRTTQPPAASPWSRLPPATEPALDLSKPEPLQITNKSPAPLSQPREPQRQVYRSVESDAKPTPASAPQKQEDASQLQETPVAGPSISKDDMLAYHTEMQSAAERARKRRQEEEDARAAEAKRATEERLRALDEKMKASQKQQEPPAAASTKIEKSAQAPAEAESEKQAAPASLPEKIQPRKILAPPRSQPQQESASPGPVQPSRSDTSSWRRPSPSRPALSPQEVVAQKALKETDAPRHDHVNKTLTVPSKGPFAPKQPHSPKQAAVPQGSRTERVWRRATPIAAGDEATIQSPKSFESLAPRAMAPSQAEETTSNSIAAAAGVASEQPTSRSSAPVMSASLWPQELTVREGDGAAIDSIDVSPVQSTDDAVLATSDRETSFAKSGGDEKTEKARTVSFAPDHSPAHGDGLDADAKPRVKLNGPSRPAPAPALSSPPIAKQQQHKSALNPSSFDDALARIKGVMAASSTASLPATASKESPRGRSRPSKPVPVLSDEELADIMKNFAVSSRERSPSPRPVWKIIPKVKLPTEHLNRQVPPLSSHQLRALKRASHGKPPPVRCMSVGPGYESSRDQLFHRRGAPIVKLKPSSPVLVVEARPIRDPKPGHIGQSGPWRQKPQEISSNANEEDLVATGKDIFDNEKATPVKPKINVVLPTPRANLDGHSSAAAAASPIQRPSPKPQVRLPSGNNVIARPTAAYPSHS